VEFVVKLKGLNIEAIRQSYIDIACPEEMIFFHAIWTPKCEFMVTGLSFVLFN
jgi:hypothetical protein